ncbi:nitroreductase family protein [Terricaulis silvestris]|uniref:Putative NAD(P)H nitroreductase n=1 Tax=Terricaulis silvestris TaxID=2686094 RepID=A0A6I6MKV1_9CAUL|nr:nitroreductase [Terricaulis silvestris]QGZ94641.1 Putative NAD(P)H nitroreductase YdjA [Terricaulis silvestris]
MVLSLSVIPTQPVEGQPADAIHESADTLALLARRRSSKVMHLVEPAPTSAEIDALVALASRVPDHGKLGPWRFVVFEGDARARAGEALAKAIANDSGIDVVRLDHTRNLLKRAPACVMVVSSAAPHPKIPEWEQQLSSGAACFSLLLAAHAMGYGGCWLTEWPAYDARARTALGLAEHERIAGIVYLGTPREGAIERVRPDVSTRISRF